MKRYFTLWIFLFLISCGVRNTQEMLNSGDYDNAIDKAVYALSKGKDKKGNQEYVYILEDAYKKAADRDQREIDLLIKDASPRNLERIFNMYLQLNNRQEKVRALLPLTKIKENKEAKFEFRDYSEQIVSSKNALAKYLYDNTKALMATRDKMNYRRAYDDLGYLNEISPNYKDVSQLRQEALKLGSDYVNVFTRNDTKMMIPVQLENDLLDFSTYGLNDKWTVYHSRPQPGTVYDYEIVVNFRQIAVSPEQIREKAFERERRIKVGQRKKTVRGRVVKDSLGKPVMEDVFKTVVAHVREYSQIKSSQVVAKVDYYEVRSNQLLKTFPISSEFVFENRYAKMKGDRRAVEKEYYPFFDQRPLPFPSNEQMVFDTGEDLKAKLKGVILRNRLRG